LNKQVRATATAPRLGRKRTRKSKAGGGVKIKGM